jgi:hypothetical protein
MYAYVHVCECESLSTDIFGRISIYVYVYAYAYVYDSVHAYMHMQVVCMYARMYTGHHLVHLLERHGSAAAFRKGHGLLHRSIRVRVVRSGEHLQRIMSKREQSARAHSSCEDL